MARFGSSVLVLLVVTVYAATLAAAQSSTRASSLAYSLTAPTNLSVTDLPRSGDVYESSLQYCKELNTETCGVITTSVWKFPACCARQTNFSTSADDVASDCTFLGLPYSAAAWTCESNAVKACCKGYSYLSYFLSSSSSSSSNSQSCPADYPESSCCSYSSSPSSSSNTCTAVRNANGGTCKSQVPSASYLVCTPQGVAAAIRATGASLASALLSPTGASSAPPSTAVSGATVGAATSTTTG